MNKKLNLVEILKDCPKGTKFYSTIFGEVKFDEIRKESNYPIGCVTTHSSYCRVTTDGRYYGDWNVHYFHQKTKETGLSSLFLGTRKRSLTRRHCDLLTEYW